MKDADRKNASDDVLASHIGYHLAKAEVVTMRLFFQHIGEPLALRPVEYSLLVLLSAGSGRTPKQLAQALALQAPSLTMVVDRLVERGLVKRMRSETDRRSQRVLLTDAGQALCEQALARQPAMYAEFNRVLSAAEQMMLRELLSKLATLTTRQTDR